MIYCIDPEVVHSWVKCGAVKNALQQRIRKQHGFSLFLKSLILLTL